MPFWLNVIMLELKSAVRCRLFDALCMAFSLRIGTLGYCADELESVQKFVDFQNYEICFAAYFLFISIGVRLRRE